MSSSEHSDDWLDGYMTGQADAIKVKSLVADGAITTLAANVERLTKQLHGATDALRKYGNHKWTCTALASTHDRKAPCDCGWDDALAHAQGQ